MFVVVLQCVYLRCNIVRDHAGTSRQPLRFGLEEKACPRSARYLAHCLLEHRAFLRVLQMARIHTNLPMAWEVLQGLPEFWQLGVALHEEARGSYRHMLSHHTSTPCQPGKQPGPVTSLKACGMDTQLGGPGEWRVAVILPHAYEHDDGLWVEYASPAMQSFATCKAEACKTLLMIFLANRPLGVHLHVQLVGNPDRIRECAAQVFMAGVGKPGVSAGAPLPWPVDMPARDRPDPAGSCFPRRNTDAPDAEQQVREALHLLTPNVEYYPGRLPRRVISVFAGALARGTLRTTLEGMPDLLEVSGPRTGWCFKVRPAPEAEPMPGNPGVFAGFPADPPHQAAAAMPGDSGVSSGAAAFAAPTPQAAAPPPPQVAAAAASSFPWALDPDLTPAALAELSLCNNDLAFVGPLRGPTAAAASGLGTLGHPPSDPRRFLSDPRRFFSMRFVGEQCFLWDEMTGQWRPKTD